MTVVSFEAAAPALEKGIYVGTIESTGIISPFGGGSVFSVRWDIGGRTIIDKFKLWDFEETKKTYAQDKLANLCKIAGVSPPPRKSMGEKIDFDTSALVGKKVKVLVHMFSMEDGNSVPFIQKYEALDTVTTMPTLADGMTASSFLNDEIPL